MAAESKKLRPYQSKASKAIEAARQARDKTVASLAKKPIGPGDVVRLKSDIRAMTVEFTRRNEAGVELAHVAWFLDEHGYLQQDTIALAALVRVS